MSGPGHASGVAWAAQRRVAEPGGGLPRLCLWQGKSPKESRALKIAPPGLSPAKQGLGVPEGGSPRGP